MSEWQEPAERGPQWEVVRVGAPERDAATRDLLAHLEAGRLTSVEYEDRTVQVSRATTWGDLVPIFADLPDPRPSPPATMMPSHQAFPNDSQGAPSPYQSGGAGRERWRETAVAASPIVALLLFFLTGSWLWFLAIPLVAVIAYGGKGRPPRRR